MEAIGKIIKPEGLCVKGLERFMADPGVSSVAEVTGRDVCVCAGDSGEICSLFLRSASCLQSNFQRGHGVLTGQCVGLVRHRSSPQFLQEGEANIKP